jgi:hypothetical protein
MEHLKLRIAVAYNEQQISSKEFELLLNTKNHFFYIHTVWSGGADRRIFYSLLST